MLAQEQAADPDIIALKYFHEKNFWLAHIWKSDKPNKFLLEMVSFGLD